MSGPKICNFLKFKFFRTIFPKFSLNLNLISSLNPNFLKLRKRIIFSYKNSDLERNIECRPYILRESDENESESARLPKNWARAQEIFLSALKLCPLNYFHCYWEMIDFWCSKLGWFEELSQAQNSSLELHVVFVSFHGQLWTITVENGDRNSDASSQSFEKYSDDSCLSHVKMYFGKMF